MRVRILYRFLSSNYEEKLEVSLHGSRKRYSGTTIMRGMVLIEIDLSSELRRAIVKQPARHYLTFIGGGCGAGERWTKLIRQIFVIDMTIINAGLFVDFSQALIT